MLFQNKIVDQLSEIGIQFFVFRLVALEHKVLQTKFHIFFPAKVNGMA